MPTRFSEAEKQAMVKNLAEFLKSHSTKNGPLDAAQLSHDDKLFLAEQIAKHNKNILANLNKKHGDEFPVTPLTCQNHDDKLESHIYNFSPEERALKLLHATEKNKIEKGIIELSELIESFKEETKDDKRILEIVGQNELATVDRDAPNYLYLLRNHLMTRLALEHKENKKIRELLVKIDDKIESLNKLIQSFEKNETEIYNSWEKNRETDNPNDQEMIDRLFPPLQIRPETERLKSRFSDATQNFDRWIGDLNDATVSVTNQYPGSGSATNNQTSNRSQKKAGRD